MTFTFPFPTAIHSQNVTFADISANNDIFQAFQDPFDSTKFYVVGSFTSVTDADGTYACTRLACIDVSLAKWVQWFPVIGAGTALAVCCTSDTVYVGGTFTSAGATTRNRAAAFLKSDASLTSFNPNFNDEVRVFDNTDATNLYVGGLFTTVGGTTRNHNCRVAYSDGALDTSWNAGVASTAGNRGGSVLIAGDVYLFGDFTSVQSTSRSRYAAVDDSGNPATLRSFNPNLTANGALGGRRGWGILNVDGTDAIIFGQFTGVGGTARGHAAKVALTDGALQSWDPDYDSHVYCGLIDGTNVYMGGTYGDVGGTARFGISKVSLSDGTVDAGFDADVSDPLDNNGVRGIAIYGDTLIIVGSFTQVGGEAHSRVAFINKNTGALI